MQHDKQKGKHGCHLQTLKELVIKPLNVRHQVAQDPDLLALRGLLCIAADMPTCQALADCSHNNQDTVVKRVLARIQLEKSSNPHTRLSIS